MIHGKGIYKSFGQVEVLKGIDIDIAKGEMVSIMGQSGAGKTTLLQILGTLDTPNQGLVEIDGVDVSKLNERKLSEFRNLHIGFVFQFHQLLPEFTALENVMIPALIAKRSKSEAEKSAKEILEQLGLSYLIDHKHNQLSVGEKQRVAVARSIINKPSVVFADEPSGSLDTKNKEELHQLFIKLRDDFNQTLVIVTHDSDLSHISNRTLMMKDGKFVENL